MSGRSRKQKPRGAATPPAATLRKATVSKSPRPTLSRRRKWLFRLTVMLAAPVLFFTLLEAGLRLGGYGYPTALFVGPDAHGSYNSNNRFGWRFFPRSLARAPVPSLISSKPPGVVRIFVLGSSAAQGIPDPSFSVGRILEVLLRNRYPDVKFEVINAAMTAINSHVVLEIARDCAAYQPDLFVVYMGNNEVIGPYGPGTVFQQWSPSRKLIRANVWLKSTRVGQLLGDATGWLAARKASPVAWQGMEMFVGNQVPADDPRLQAVYDNFRQNLTDICGIARQAGAGVILSTVAVNLKDCPPFASQHRSDLPPKDLAKWKSLDQAGVELENAQKWPEAIAKYKAASQIDDRFAEVPFRIGRCLAALGRYAEAHDQFVLARDLDALRFRADSKTNAVIRKVGGEQEPARVRLVDAEQSLANSPLAVDGIPGEGLFYEHVHLTFDGNYLLARALLDEVAAALPQLAASRKQEPILSRDQCAEAMALTPWDEYQMAQLMMGMTSRSPFTDQLDHAVRQDSKRKQTQDLGRLSSTPQAMQAACATYEAALERSPDDWCLHARLGKLAGTAHQPKVALEQTRFVANKLRSEPTAYNDLGNAAKNCGRLDEAIFYLQKALVLDPTFAMAHNSLGSVLDDCGRSNEAIAEFQKALEIDPNFASAHYNLACSLDGRGRTDEAVAEYRKALKIDADFVAAHNNLANTLKKLGRTDEAIAEYRKALEIDPGYMAARSNLANTLKKLGRTDEAVAEYRAALKIDAGSVTARYGLANILMERGKTDEVIAEYERILEIDPKAVLAHNNLGILLAGNGQIDKAIAHFRTALEIQPGYAEARANLQKAMETRDRAGQGQ